MVELVDTPVLGTGAFGRGGSSPLSGTKKRRHMVFFLYLRNGRIRYNTDMKRILIALLLMLPMVGFAERISSYDVDVEIELDGSLLVRETIAYDFEEEERRGIYRDIPLYFEVGESKRQLDIALRDVRRNGNEEPYALVGDGPEWNVRIGQEDVYLSGVQQYMIEYEVRGALRYFDAYDELYWNAIGFGWDVPVDQWSVEVVTPARAEVLQERCYWGDAGSTDTCDGAAGIYSGSGLAAGEGVTVALGFTPGVVAYQVYEREPWWGIVNWIGLVTYVGALGVFGWYVVSSFFRHRRKISRVVQYDSYDDYSALFTGYWIDGQINNRDIVAGVVELAQKRIIDITQTGNKQYTCTCRIDATEYQSLLPIEKKLLVLLFGGDAGVTKGSTYTTGDAFSLNRYEQLVEYVGKQAMKRALREKYTISWRMVVASILLMVLGSVLMGPYVVVGAMVVGVNIVVFALVGAAFGRLTQKGYEARNHIKGLRDYISVAEEKRIEFHDAPEKNPETFSTYLPFAIAFGQEKKWIAEFADMVDSIDWLRDSHGQPMPVTAMAGALSGIDSSVSSSMPAPATSGSGGGGFSGGGAGGGGGGSW